MSYKKVGTFAPQPATERGRSIQLSSDPKNNFVTYANGRSIIIRDLKTPSLATEYTGHSCHATVARYAPSGYYIASGGIFVNWILSRVDVQGNVRIWDTVNAEHILKTETKPFSGKINDLAWDFESKRLVVVGEGKDKFGHAFLWDSGSSCGEILGHSKAVNSVSLRPGRPIRAVTGSDDFSVNFYHGVPFKFVKSVKEHSRFVQCVRYDPTGTYFASAGSDSRIILYEGKECEKRGEFEVPAHGGTVFSISWDGEGKRLLSASADGTAKIWDVATLKATNTVKFFNDKVTPDSQQVGSLWAGSYLITTSLKGDLNYLDPRSEKPVQIVKGHQKSITAMAAASPSKYYTGSYDGRVVAWEDGVGEDVGNSHSNAVVGMGVLPQLSTVVSCGMDDSVRLLSSTEKSFKGTAFPTGSTPKGIAVGGEGIAAVITSTQVLLYKDSSVLKSIVFPSGISPTAVAVDPTGQNVAVGGEDMKVYIYSIASGAATGLVFEGNRGTITCIAYSPDSKILAVGDSNAKILGFDASNASLLYDQWVFHTGRINSIAWNPDSKHLVSTSLDTNVEIWSTIEPMKHISIKNAHLESATYAVFAENNKVVSVGGDAFIRTWEINFL